MTNQEVSEKAVEQYLAQLRKELKGMNRTEMEDILTEIRSHIQELPNSLMDKDRSLRILDP